MIVKKSKIFLLVILAVFFVSPVITEAAVDEAVNNLEDEVEEIEVQEELDHTEEIVVDPTQVDNNTEVIEVKDKNSFVGEYEEELEARDESKEENEEIIEIKLNSLIEDLDNEDEERANPVTTTIYRVNTQESVLILENSISHQSVIDLKNDLGKLGFTVPGNTTNYFGDDTEQKVKEFQQYYGVNDVSGVAGTTTLAKIREILSSPLQIGKRDAGTITLKQKLVIVGFPVPGNTTNYYGEGTKQKVIEFQKKYGLVANGIADSITLTKLEELSKNVFNDESMYMGLYREDVISLKINLGKLGFTVPGNTTNYFGKATEQKVNEFQQYYGVNDTSGVAGVKTVTKIEEILSSPFQIGKRDAGVITIKQKLNSIGLSVPGNNTNYYGEGTKQRVIEFQMKYGLVVNGIVDSITLNKLEELSGNPVLDESMYMGLYRDDVISLKINLGKLGFVVLGNTTNYFGKGTEQKVNEFQQYYGVNDTSGVAGVKTLTKIEEILSSPFQFGKRDTGVIKIKQKLGSIGLSVPGNNTNYYGEGTKQRVIEFQMKYGLVVNGIVDSITLNKLEELSGNPVPDESMYIGLYRDDVISLKINLGKLGFVVNGNTTNYFGKDTERKVIEFQRYYNVADISGVAGKTTLAKIEHILSSPLQNGKRHKDTIKLKKDLAKIGLQVSMNPTNYYGSDTVKIVKQFQKENGLKTNGIADEVTLEKLSEIVRKSNENIKIFLDPGHGGKDPGATGYGLMEKNVVLDISLTIANILTTKYAEVEVMLSRTTDTFIELEDRATLANNWEADYFISIHNNAFNGAVNGFETFIYNGKVSNLTKVKQKEIHQDLIKELKVLDRGMKEANFSVLRNTTMPALLIEYLFIDNPKENNLLKSSSYRKWLGEITAEAIARAYNLEKK